MLAERRAAAGKRQASAQAEWLIYSNQASRHEAATIVVLRPAIAWH